MGWSNKSPGGTIFVPSPPKRGTHLLHPRRPLIVERLVYRVTQLRTDGVHCRESTGTEPVNLKIVPNGCCLGRSPWTN